jgi:hypothetical protein
MAKLAIKWVVVICVQNHNTIWHSFDSVLPNLVPQNLLGNGLLLFMSKTQHKMHSLDLSPVDQVWQNLLGNGFLLFMSKHNTIWHFVDLALLDQVWKNLQGNVFC